MKHFYLFNRNNMININNQRNINQRNFNQRNNDDNDSDSEIEYSNIF